MEQQFVDNEMDIWAELIRFGKSCRHPIFETTLLGHVEWKETKTGELTGYIPPELQMEANKHGLLIECALYREGKYVMRILPSYDSPRQSGPC